MGRASRNDRNAPCLCGSGLKTKFCHRDGYAAVPNDQPADESTAGHSHARWGAFLDDTEVDFDSESGAPAAPTKTWSAIVVPPVTLPLFRASAAELVAEYC